MKEKRVVRVTTRTRFGYDWNNSPVQTPTGLEVMKPTQPAVKGLGWKQLKAAHQRAARINQSCYWVAVVFLGGRRLETSPSNLLFDLELNGWADVVVES